MNEYVGVLMLAVFYCAVVGAIIGDIRDMAGRGFALGLFCGPVGWIVVACLCNQSNPSATPIPRKRELIMKCKCGVGLNVAFLQSGSYECPICGHHLEITNDPAK